MRIYNGLHLTCSSLIVLSLLTVFSTTGAQGIWTTKASMPTLRASFGIGVINNKLYVVGGENTGGALDIVEVYDPATDTWDTTRAAMPTKRHTFAIEVINNKLYAVGGQNTDGNILGTVEEYDPVMDKWTTKASMPTPRHGLAIGVINNKLYAIGGHDPNSAIIEVYDPATDSWDTTKAPMLTARGLFAIGVVNNKLYSVGGNLGGQQSLDTVEEYNPTTDSWTTKASMPTPRHVFAIGVVNNKLYAVGGFTAPSTYLNTVEEYDPAMDQWKTMNPMPTARIQLGIGNINGKLYAVGGKDPSNNYLSIVDEFIPLQAISFTKYDKNPVLNIGSPGQLDDTHVLSPSVLKIGNEYKMWYTGHDGTVGRIFYATSTDGITWTKYSTTPVLDLGESGEWDDVEVSHPSVIFDNGIYKMWYTGYHSGSLHQTGYATSSDGISWERHPGNPVLTPGPEGWDNTAVMMPMVIKDGTTYKMWYCGYTPGILYQIGYATSEDGINWTKHSSPVIQKGSNGAWDATALESPSMVKIDSLYYAFYTAQASPGAPRKIGYATSLDGINWTKYGNNPILTIGSEGKWDDTEVGHQSVIYNYNNGTYEMWYSGHDGTNQRIGYANSTGEFRFNPVIGLSDTILNFGTIHVDSSENQILIISNNGGDILRVTDINNNLSVFTVSDTTANIAPGESFSDTITFKPDSAENYTDTLTIFSNDPIQGILKVVLAGTGRKTVVAPTLSSPSDSATNISTYSTLQWNPSSEAFFYQLQVATNKNFSTLIVNAGDITDTSYTISGLTRNTTYYWRVKVASERVVSDWSSVWQFTTIAQMHFEFTSNTGRNATIAIPFEADPNIAGTPLAVDDEIGVFTPNGLCVGAVIWTGENTVITVWGDDNQTDDEVDGIQAGEQMSYHIWRLSTKTEYTNVSAAYSLGNGIYTDDGIYILSSLSAVLQSLPQTLPISADTSTLVFQTIDSTQASIVFKSGNVTGHTIAFQNFGIEPPDTIKGIDNPILYFSLNTTIPDTSQFSAQVILKYTDAQIAAAGINESSLKVAWFNEKNSTWNFVQADLDTSKNTLTFNTQQFSIWVIVSAQAILSLSSNNIDFGVVETGTFKDTIVTITNNGNDTLRISNITSSDSVFTVSPIAFDVSPDQSSDATLRFTPVTDDSVSATLQILSNAATSPDTIGVSGKGITKQAILELSSAEIEFGVVETGSFKDTTITITNSGNDTLKVSKITSTNPVFTANPDSFKVSPNESLDVTLSFTPTAGDTVSAELTVESNAPTSPDTIRVIGVGLTKTLTIPADTNTIKFLTSDSTQATITFQSGDVAGYKVTLETFGTDPPVVVQVVPTFDDPLVYFEINSTIPTTTTFSAKITIRYTNNQLADAGTTNEDSLKVAWFDETDSTWNIVQTTVDTVANMVEFETDQFSIWAIASVTPTEIEDLTASQKIPKTFSLNQNYPNPFNPETKIEYGLPKAVQVRLVIYNILGQEVRTLVNMFQPAGYHSVVWDGRDNQGQLVSSGIFLYRLTAGEFTQMRKMVLLR